MGYRFNKAMKYGRVRIFNDNIQRVFKKRQQDILAELLYLKIEKERKEKLMIKGVFLLQNFFKKNTPNSEFLSLTQLRIENINRSKV